MYTFKKKHEYWNRCLVWDYLENLFTFASHDGGIPMGKELQSYYLLVQGVNSPVLYYSLQIQTFDIDIFIYFASVFFLASIYFQDKLHLNIDLRRYLLVHSG